MLASTWREPLRFLGYFVGNRLQKFKNQQHLNPNSPSGFLANWYLLEQLFPKRWDVLTWISRHPCYSNILGRQLDTCREKTKVFPWPHLPIPDQGSHFVSAENTTELKVLKNVYKIEILARTGLTSHDVHKDAALCLLPLWMTNFTFNWFICRNKYFRKQWFCRKHSTQNCNQNGTLFLHSQQEEIRAITSSKTNRFVRNRCCLEFISLPLWSNPGRCRDFMNCCQIYLKRCE